MGINERIHAHAGGSGSFRNLPVCQSALTDLPISEPCRARAGGLFLQFFRGRAGLSQKTGLAFPCPHPRPDLPKIVYCSDFAEAEGHPPRRKADKEGLPGLMQVSPGSQEREPYDHFQPGRYSSEASLCVSQCRLGTGFSLLLVSEADVL